MTSLAFEQPLRDDPWRPAALAALRESLAAIVDRDWSSLPVPARVAAQNDVWGLWQQLREHNAPRDLQDAAAALVFALAVEPSAVPLADEELPAAVIEAIGPGPYHERGTELAVLGHEWDYGLRRIFRFIEGPGGSSAMFSQLVAIDPSGQTHLTDVVGEIEQLQRGIHRGDIRGAMVFELDRASLANASGRSSLRRVEPLAHIPATGANHFLAAFEPAISLRDVPCRQCHADDDITGSPLLPTNDDPAPRRAALLEGHPALAAGVDSDLAIGLRTLVESGGS